MKKLMTLSALFLSMIGNGAFAQCPAGDVNLFTQSDIHTFVAAFPNCTEIGGNLVLGKLGAPSDIEDLSGLIGLTKIDGSLKIMGNPNLVNLDGLENISFIGNDLLVTNCPAMTSLQGLNGIKHVTGTASFSYMDNLSSLEGLENLEIIGKDFSLFMAPLLADFTGLSSLTSIYGSMVIDQNDGLGMFVGLENLQMIGVDLIVKGNASLIRFDGLENLGSIGRDLRIGWEYVDGNVGNPSLSNLDGLKNLTVIGRDFHLIDNDLLTTLEGMTGLGSIGGRLWVVNNENLSLCATEPICAYLTNGGSATIGENAEGCASLQEVSSQCGITGAPETPAGKVLTLHPNPASGEVNLDCGGAFPIDRAGLYSTSGSLVAEFISPGYRIDLSGIPAGMYFIRIQAGSVNFVNRLLVQ